MSKKALLLSTLLNRVSVPESVDFDGANDYVSWASDLTGNADGKTATASFFWYNTNAANASVYSVDNDYFQLKIGDGTKFEISARNSAGTQILSAASGTNTLPLNTWCHLVVSFDLANASNRSCYLNDSALSLTWFVYTNDAIDFTRTSHRIAQTTTGVQKLKGRLAHVFLDYQYRNLSIEANRRLFIDADGLPVDASGLSPILYMKMTDAASVAVNSGTGGDGTLNGVVATSGRGANQYNAPASTFDGVADYLRNALVSFSGQVISGSFNFKTNNLGTSQEIFRSNSPNTELEIALNSSGNIIFFGDGGNINFSVDFTHVGDKFYSFQFRLDLTNQSNSQFLVDGVSQTITVSSYVTGGTFSFSDVLIGASSLSPGSPWNGELSDLWFDDSSVSDLTGFYDTDTGKPKYLGSQGELPTGSQPLIYLPLRGDDAGNNLGSGGDFTVNSGPYTGARSFSEFWAGSAEFNGTTQYLSAGSLTGISDGKIITIVGALQCPSTGGEYVLAIGDAGSSSSVQLTANATNLEMICRNSAGSNILVVNSSTDITDTTWHTFAISFDLSDVGKRSLIIDGADDSPTWSTYTNDTIDLTKTLTHIGRATSASSNFFSNKLGFLWFNTEYIDFSQEANRLKFFDAFGFPCDLGDDGSLPTGSQPLIYMNNDFHLGTNAGSGGNFTPVNTPVSGGDVKG